MQSLRRLKRFVGASGCHGLVLAWGLMACSYAPVECAEPLIEQHAGGWRYCDAPSALADQPQFDRWTEVDYDDTSWPQGQAILGYGDADVTTELSFGNHPQRKESSALLRRRFRVAGRGRFRLLRGRICCDDGAVVFLNGREVYRWNVPSGTVNYATRAVKAIGPDAADERSYRPFAVPSDSLADGENVVAVSVHQANRTSSDLAIDLELAALTTAEEVNSFRDELKGQAVEAGSQTGPVVSFKISGE
jgi:hypothetical protein